VQINYDLPSVKCPEVPYPFSYELESAAAPDFLVRCLRNGRVHLPAIDVLITTFGDGFITTDKYMYQQVRAGACGVPAVGGGQTGAGPEVVLWVGGEPGAVDLPQAGVWRCTQAVCGHQQHGCSWGLSMQVSHAVVACMR
jgi:hypothetical protein